MIKMMLIAGAGGFIGTCGRFLIGRWCATAFHGAFPLGTFITNIIGCFVFGLVFGFLERSHIMSPGMNALLITGFCGGFTTFSTFASDVLSLGSRGDWGTTILYLVSSTAAGIFLVWVGRALVR